MTFKLPFSRRADEEPGRRWGGGVGRLSHAGETPYGCALRSGRSFTCSRLQKGLTEDGRRSRCQLTRSSNAILPAEGMLLLGSRKFLKGNLWRIGWQEQKLRVKF